MEQIAELNHDDDHDAAVKACCDISNTNRLVAVSGQAGTGKTTILRRVYRLLRDAGYRVVMCAPTGKAARRITEATGIKAYTIHRLLEYPYPGERDKNGKALMPGQPKRRRDNPLDYDVVLADEYRMVNHELHRNLINALPSGGCLRAFGDENQLAPVETNARLRLQPTPFEVILDQFTGQRLTTIHRQGEGSGIILNGDRILRGRTPLRKPDFNMKLTHRVVDGLMEEVKAHADGYRSLDYQVITPTKKSWVGTAKLNALMQTYFQRGATQWLKLPRFEWATDKDTRITIGDKVIWTENDYNVDGENGGVMNGETGIIVSLDDNYGTFDIDFGDRIVEVPPVVLPDVGIPYDPRRAVDLAYAITTHKSQGSEYERVSHVIAKEIFYMLCRPNLYTAVTRAKKHVNLVCDQNALRTAVNSKLSRMDLQGASKKKMIG